MEEDGHKKKNNYMEEDGHKKEDNYMEEDSHKKENKYLEEDGHKKEDNYMEEDSHKKENKYLEEDGHKKEDNYIEEASHKKADNCMEEDGQRERGQLHERGCPQGKRTTTWKRTAIGKEDHFMEKENDNDIALFTTVRFSLMQCLRLLTFMTLLICITNLQIKYSGCNQNDKSKIDMH